VPSRSMAEQAAILRAERVVSAAGARYSGSRAAKKCRNRMMVFPSFRALVTLSSSLRVSSSVVRALCAALPIADCVS
jgi:hypothetical protein